jgi:hypothetical protein
MQLVKRAMISILRPIYKLFLERPLWWFLARVKAFLLAEIGPQLESNGHRLAAIEGRLRSAEGNDAAQWSALEQLLLAMYRQPEVRIDASGICSEQAVDLTTSAAGPDRAHERK